MIDECDEVKFQLFVYVLLFLAEFVLLAVFGFPILVVVFVDTHLIALPM